MPIWRPTIMSTPTGIALFSEGGARTFVSLEEPEGRMAVHLDGPQGLQADRDVGKRFAEITGTGKKSRRISLFTKLASQHFKKWTPPSVRDHHETIYYADLYSHLSRTYFASNEFDFYKQPIDQREAEIFVGFGNNSVWDLAIRRNAKRMIIGDHDEQVIIFQEYLYRPLFAISRTPAEFISLLAGVRLPPELVNVQIDGAFEFVEQYLDAYPRTGTRPTRERFEYAEEIADRVRKYSGLSEKHAEFVEKHLKWIARPERSHEHGFDGPGSPVLTYANMDNAYDGFRYRYYPKELLEDGADPAIVHHPFFSFLSSQEAFERLKNLFANGKVSYFVADIEDRRAFNEIERIARTSGLKVSGLSISNIIDCTVEDQTEAASMMTRILGEFMSEVEVDQLFTVYYTRGKSAPHTYEVISHLRGSELHI